MSDSWRLLLEAKWGNYVVLHNFPIGFIEIHNAVVQKCVATSFSSIYEMQKSVVDWHPIDFKIHC